ncbi:MAG: hypothetical protein P8J50_03665 [Acidimicrobiales bacterium]|jgi:hypothetical protein|nr:hypothetical protein [Acidimicrobiales bacterium]
MSTPCIDGLEASFTDVNAEDDGIPFIPVRSQRNADGTDSHVWEKWVAFSVEPLYLALFARWDPGMIVRHHGHYSPHTLTVLKGELTCEDKKLGVGGHIELPLGASFGPFVAGPDGCELYEVMMGDPRSWSEDPDSIHEWLAERGAVQLPDPPIELPGGLEDLRAVFAKGAEQEAEASD